MKKKISLILIVSLFLNSLIFSNIYAENSSYTKAINTVTNKINKLMINKDFNKIFIYISLLNQTKNNSKDNNRRQFIDNVIQELKKQYHRNNTNLILRIDKNYSNKNIDDIIEKNSDKIKLSDNIFIFKNNATWRFSASQMFYTSNKLKLLNKKIRIFIDQEGWLVNRFNDFDDKNTFENYINSNLSLRFKYAILEDNTKNLITNSFKNRTTFISMNSVWEIFYSINKNNTTERNRFLDFITFFRLYTLYKNWINTHWIVTDLDKSNPVISWLKRSFSDNINDYVNLWKYFVKNARILWMSLYLKHFPGHWRWNIDTHKWILEYSDNKNDKKYIVNNMRVFETIMYNAHKSWVEIWIMSAHVLLPDSIKNKYLQILNKADYIMTDDLWMWAYLKLKDKVFENKFFSTNEFIDNKNTIRVYTKENEIK